VPVPIELGPTVFLPDTARLAYWRAGQATYARGAEQPEAIRAGLEAAAALSSSRSFAPSSGPDGPGWTRPQGL
jgi:hypothetical protein